MVFEKFKIKTSLSAVGRLLKKYDIKRFKSGSIPAKADTEKQRIFYESILRPLIRNSQKSCDHISCAQKIISNFLANFQVFFDQKTSC
jgi:hypothetical protein